MDTTFFDQAAARLERLDAIAEEIKGWNRAADALDAPEQPQFVSHLSEWRDYEAKVLDYRTRCNEIGQCVATLNQEEAGIRLWLRKNLPTNTWFRVETRGGDRWVGVETSDWGGGEWTLMIKKSRPEQPLKHRVTS